MPGWLSALAWVFLTLSLASAAAIAYDIRGRGYRHTHPATELVWIASALYLGPVALPLYARRGRTQTQPGSGTTDRATGVRVQRTCCPAAPRRPSPT